MQLDEHLRLHLVLGSCEALVLHAEAEDEHAAFKLDHFVELARAHRNFKHFVEGYLRQVPQGLELLLREKMRQGVREYQLNGEEARDLLEKQRAVRLFEPLLLVLLQIDVIHDDF